MVSTIIQAASTVPDQVFEPREVERHRASLPEFLAAARVYLQETYRDHVAFYQRWGVSKYYGNRRREYSTREGRMRELERYGKPTHLADLQIGTACILLAMNCLKAGFTATRTENTWEKILDVLKVGDKFLGTDLQVLLQQLGWTMCYWNPDPSKNAEWDAEDRRLNPPKEGRQWNPVWGGHAARYRTVISRRQYSGKRVDDATTLVGFQSSPPLAFQSVPLFVGTAHDGYHVFPGFFGEVVEAHSTRRLIDRDNIEVSHFNPLGRGGGPRWTLTEKYRSGLIVVP